VRTLHDRGYEVTYTYRTEPAEGATEIAAVRLDLADSDAVETFASTQESGPGWDVLVHVGGTTYDTLAAMVDQSKAEQAMQVNFFAFTRIARAVVRPMLR